MGSLSAAIRNFSGSDENARRTKERMELLLVGARAKIRAYKDEINEMFMNPDSIKRIQIPGIRSIRFIEQYHVASQQGFNEQVARHLDAAIDAFFSLNKAPDKAGAIKSGVKALIQTALDGFIGSTSAGESEERVYVVIPENNAFVRVDIACWRYNFIQKDFLAESDSAVAYVLCKSVVDHRALAIDELIYLATDALSERTGRFVPEVALGQLREALGKHRVAVAKGTEGEKAALKAAVDGISDANMKSLLTQLEKAEVAVPWVIENDFLAVGPSPLPQLDVNQVSSATPADISTVQTYIEELLRVWRELRDENQQ